MADKIKIGLDAGHGGDSTGTYSVRTETDGIYEKTYALELCRLVRDRLLANGFEVFMTRDSDIKPGNVSERARQCIAAGCAYAVSIHFNGSTNTGARGTEVFVPYAESAAGIEAGYQRYLGAFFPLRAPLARSSDINNKDDVFDKKLNLVTRKFDAVSTTKKNYFGFVRTGWAGGMSADLLEVCFLTNGADFSAYLANREAVASAIARAITEGYRKVYQEEKPESPEPPPKEPLPGNCEALSAENAALRGKLEAIREILEQ